MIMTVNQAINKETMIGIEIVYVDSPPNQIMNVHQKNCLSENKKYQPTVMLLEIIRKKYTLKWQVP